MQFTTTTGEIIEVEGHSGIAVPLYSKGEKVTVYYEANNPKNFALDSEFEQSTPYIALIILWMVVATGIVYYVSR
ncbi:DUF3592 domain-containing protein [uncultured Hymenobacter sp.]|uniref:DUF3592 domain-containing protein n=1 Tax=uncultured Hymenobacter sp. TaxID=170016 RepID=UPI0035CA777F